MKKFLIALVILLALGTAFIFRPRPKPEGPALQFLVEVQADEPYSSDQYVDTKRAILKRMNAAGIACTVERLGEGEPLVITVPRPQDDAEATQLRDLVSKSNSIAFHTVSQQRPPEATPSENPDGTLNLESLSAPEGYVYAELRSNDSFSNEVSIEPLFISATPTLDATPLVKSADSNVDHSPTSFVIHLEFNDEGAKKFSELTGAHVGERLAIVIDGTIATAPMIQMPIEGGKIFISGFDSPTAAAQVAHDLSYPLPYPVTILQEEQIIIPD